MASALHVTHNGPAIKGGCVTWRSHPATSLGTLATRLSRWQDRYGVLFAYPGTKFIAFVSDRGPRYISGQKFIPVYKFDKWAHAQYRGTKPLSGWKFIRVQNVVNGEGAYPGADLKTCPGKWLKFSKKHDKQLTFIGRVRHSNLLESPEKMFVFEQKLKVQYSYGVDNKLSHFQSHCNKCYKWHSR